LKAVAGINYLDTYNVLPQEAEREREREREREKEVV
jgi:hypothetical protein